MLPLSMNCFHKKEQQKVLSLQVRQNSGFGAAGCSLHSAVLKSLVQLVLHMDSNAVSNLYDACYRFSCYPRARKEPLTPLHLEPLSFASDICC